MLANDQAMSLFEAARSYAARGWPVLPLRPGQKVPATEHGLKDASTDPDVIRQWWARWPNANIGLRTGEAFDVIDLDSAEAARQLWRRHPDHMTEFGVYSSGPGVVTPRGWHLYLAPTGHGNTVRVGGIDGLDWRGRGGFVVAPPSTVDATDNHPGGSYRWRDRARYGPDAPIHWAPVWLLELLDPPRPPRPSWTPPPVDSRLQAVRYALAALRSEATAVANAPEGTRNDRLNQAAYAMRRFVAIGHLQEDRVTDTLARAAQAAGLGSGEILATIRSGLGMGR